MKILLANPRGFCAGVDMAIGTLQRALQLYGAPLYVYHEIVHNKNVVERFQRLGVVFVDDLDDVPVGSVLLFSAHGVSPLVREAAAARSLRAIDATCPLVNKVHLEIARFARQGYTVVLIGHGGHDEVVGTLGIAPHRTVLVESTEDVDRLTLPSGTPLCYVTQTTLSVDDTARIVERLRERFPQVVAPAKEDICYATQNRQQAVKSLLPQADMVLVLGSQNSSNSRRLVELAAAQDRPAHLIDSAEEIDLDWFHGVETVLVSAGASAPEENVQQCIDFLCRQFEALVEEHSFGSENVHFPLPLELRSQD